MFLPPLGFDLVLRGGTIYDGTGRAPFVADVAVRSGRIVALGPHLGPSKSALDCTGMAVAPGFIDLHTHAENILDHPGARNFVRDGTTSIVIGNCGGSELDLRSFWRSLRLARPAINVATLIGHNSVRAKAMGGDFNRPPNARELRSMQALVRRAMQKGAFGLSTGLEYVPGAYAKIDEIVALAKVAGREGGLYASHLRNEGPSGAAALDEALTIGKKAGLPVHVSHLKIDTPKFWGASKARIFVLNQARKRGQRVTQDVYPYAAYGTTLGLLLPAWALEGSDSQVAARLLDPVQRVKVKAGMANLRRTTGVRDYGWIAISRSSNTELSGLRIPDAAQKALGRNDLVAQEDLILDLMAKGGAGGVFFAMSEGDIETIMQDARSSLVCDASVGTEGKDKPHPRGYGSRARFLAHYVRERQVMSLSEAIRRLTMLPARSFGITDRGTLKAGSWADIVVFDPTTVQDRATFAEPRQFSTGFRAVLVNGKFVVRDDQETGLRPGVPILRKNRVATVSLP